MKRKKVSPSRFKVGQVGKPKLSVEFEAKVIVSFSPDGKYPHAEMVVYPLPPKPLRDYTPFIALSRFHLLMEDAPTGEASVGGFGNVMEHEADGYLQMFDVSIWPESAKTKRHLRELAKRPMPKYAKVKQ